MDWVIFAVGVLAVAAWWDVNTRKLADKHLREEVGELRAQLAADLPSAMQMLREAELWRDEFQTRVEGAERALLYQVQELHKKVAAVDRHGEEALSDAKVAMANVSTELVSALRADMAVQLKRIEEWREHFEKKQTDLSNRVAGTQAEKARGRTSWKS